MVATPTLLDSNTAVVNPATTASVSPTSGRLLELDVISTTTGGAGTVAGDFSVTGLGATWELVDFQLYGSRRGIWRFRAESDGTAGTISLQYTGAGTFAEMGWAVKEWSGQVTGANGANAVGTPVSADTFDTTLTLTIADTPATGDATSAVFGIENAGGGGSFEAGYTTLVDQVGTDTNIRQMLVGWEDAQTDSTPTVTWAAASSAGGIANLIIAAAAGGDVTAAVDHGLVLGHTVQVESTVTADTAHGLVLGHTVQAESTVNTSAAHGLVLDHAVQAQVSASAAVAHGLLLDHAVTAVVGDLDVEADVVSGLQIGHTMQVTLDLTGTGRPIQPLVAARALQPDADERPLQPLADARSIQPTFTVE